MAEIEITLPEDEWVVLEELRIEFGYDTIDELMNYILEKELRKYDDSNDGRE